MKNIEQIIKGISENGVTGFAVFEDNGGGLHLGIWYDDGQDEESFEENFFCHCSYEYNVGQLMDDLTALSEGSSPLDWENMKEMSRVEWRKMVNNEFAGGIVLNMDGFIERAHMGAAAQTEFENYL